MRSDRSVSLCCDWSNCSQSPESDGTSLDRVFDSDRQCYRVLSSVVVGFFVGFSLFFFYFFFNISTAFVDRSQVAHATPAGAGVSMFLTGTSITFYGS